MDVRTHDLQGRAYIRLADIRAGTVLQFDADFGCLDPAQVYVAKMNGEIPYVECTEGTHTLDVQADDNGGYCVGVYAAEGP